MNVIEKKSMAEITTDYAVVVSQKFVNDDGVYIPLGESSRVAYQNDVGGRELLVNLEPSEVVNSVMAFWGDTPTIEDFNDLEG